LAEREKQVLQTASVIGKQFEEPILKEALDLNERDLQHALSELKNAEFLYEQALYPVAEYAFKHPLTQEVAYNSQLAERRRRIHSVVAAAIERADPDKLDQRAALLAHHCEEAGDNLAAAGWYGRAAEWVRRSDPTECLRLWRKVRELIEPLSAADTRELRRESCLQILQVGGWRVGLSDKEVQSLYSEGQALGEENGDAHYLARLALAFAPTVGILRGDVTGYQELAREVEKLATASGDPELTSSANVLLLYSYMRGGRLAEAFDFTMRLRELSREDPDRGKETLGYSNHVFSLLMQPWIGILQGRGPEMQDVMLQGITTARREQEFEILGWMFANNAYLEFFTGRLANAEIECMEGLELSERIGSPFSMALSFRSLGLSRLERGKWADSIESFERSLGVMDELQTAREAEAEVMSWYALALVGAGEAQRGKEVAERALALANERGAYLSVVDANFALARAANANGDPDAADRACDLAAEGVRECGSRGWEPLIALERAVSARLRGDRAACERALREALRVSEELGAEGHAERAARELEQLS
jgi:adenylate cyclase